MYQCLRQTHCLHTWAWIQTKYIPSTKCYLSAYRTTHWLNVQCVAPFQVSTAKASLQIIWHMTLYHQLKVSHHFTVTDCIPLQRFFDDTVTHLGRSETWHIIVTKKQKNKHNNSWGMFVILTPIRCHEGNGIQASLLFAQLTEIHLRINVEHYPIF